MYYIVVTSTSLLPRLSAVVELGVTLTKIFGRELAFDGGKFSTCVFVLQPLSFFTSVFIIIKINVIKFCVY